MGRRWLVAALAVTAVAVASACTTGGVPGVGPEDPRSVLDQSAEGLLQAGSARISGQSTAIFASGVDPVPYDGTLTWSDGLTGVVRTDESASPPSTELITKDAVYSGLPVFAVPELLPGLVGKTWVRQAIGDPADPISSNVQIALGQANPVRSIALLVQAGDLVEFGQETRGTIATTHYGGTIEFDKVVADEQHGLGEQAVAGLRAEARALGAAVEQLDLWLDEGGHPVHADVGIRASARGLLLTRTDYSDFGGPKPTVAPRPDQVIDAAELRRQVSALTGPH